MMRVNRDFVLQIGTVVCTASFNSLMSVATVLYLPVMQLERADVEGEIRGTTYADDFGRAPSPTGTKQR